MIKLYPSDVCETPMEVHNGNWKTVREFLEDCVKDNSELLSLIGTNDPIIVKINGQVCDIDEPILRTDDVCIYPLPGWEGVLYAAIAIVAAFVAVSMMPTAQQTEQLKGKQLDSISVSANSSRYGEPIREILGSPPKVYPDYIKPPFRRWTGLKEQTLYLCLGVGNGVFTKSISRLWLGDTPVVALGNKVQAKFYEPGEDLTGDECAEFWHSPEEVGFTSSGSAGLKTVDPFGMQVSPNPAESITVNDDYLVLNGSTFPDDWAAGLTINLEVFFPITVSNNGTAKLASSVAFKSFDPFIGQSIWLNEDYRGEYKIRSYTPGQPAIPASPGTPFTVQSDASFTIPLLWASSITTFEFSINAVTYQFTLDQDFSNLSQLCTYINGQISASGTSFSVAGTRILWTKYSPPHYGQAPIDVSSNRQLLFGANPVISNGQASTDAIPGTDDEVEIENLNGSNVVGIPDGDILLGVGIDQWKYIVTSKPNDNTIYLERDSSESFNGFPEYSTESYSISLDSSEANGGWLGPITVLPEGQVTNIIEVDYIFPSGLAYFKKNGHIRPTSKSVQVQYRESGSTDAWQTVEFSHYHAERDAIGFTQRIVIPGAAINPSVRFRRAQAHENSNLVLDGIEWTALRGYLPPSNIYPTLTTLTIQVESGGSLGANSENKVWGKFSRHIDRIDGTFGETSNPADLALYILRQVGYTDQTLNLPEWERLHAIYAARGLTFDHEYTSFSTVKAVCNEILGVGYSTLITERGQTFPAMDDIRDGQLPSYVYSDLELLDYPEHNMTMAQPDDIDGIDLTYKSAISGVSEVVKYRLPGDTGQRAKAITVVGITNKDKAYQYAARERRKLKYRRSTGSFNCTLAALNSNYLSYDGIVETVKGLAQCAFVIDHVVIDDKLLFLPSEQLDFSNGNPKHVVFRRLDGTTTPAYQLEQVPNQKWLQCNNPGIRITNGLESNGYLATNVYFGELAKLFYPILVKSIKPGSDGKCQVKFEHYDRRVYLDDNTPAPD